MTVKVLPLLDTSQERLDFRVRRPRSLSRVVSVFCLWQDCELTPWPLAASQQSFACLYLPSLFRTLVDNDLEQTQADYAALMLHFTWTERVLSTPAMARFVRVHAEAVTKILSDLLALIASFDPNVLAVSVYHEVRRRTQDQTSNLTSAPLRGPYDAVKRISVSSRLHSVVHGLLLRVRQRLYVSPPREPLCRSSFADYRVSPSELTSSHQGQLSTKRFLARVYSAAVRQPCLGTVPQIRLHRNSTERQRILHCLVEMRGTQRKGDRLERGHVRDMRGR
jgi:hypothetical protein